MCQKRAPGGTTAWQSATSHACTVAAHGATTVSETPFSTPIST
jgi:hypothetical protein